MATTKSKIKDFDIINIRELARLSKIDYMKLRNNLAGKYGSLNESEQARLYNTIYAEVTKATSVLGFTYEGRRIKPKD